MKEQDKELLLKDLCSRLLYGVMVQVISKHPVILGDGSESDELDEPYDVLLTIDDHGSLVDFFNGDWVIDIKPYLRPMSSMTEEEKMYVNELIYDKDDSFLSLISIWVIDKYIDFCNSKHLDWRGLIEKGLALPATDGMYNF